MPELSADKKAQIVLGVIENFHDQLTESFIVIQIEKIRIRKV